jgi:hypothetical protein
MSLPLNLFRTIAEDVPPIETEIYEAPIGYNTIVLLAQTCNAGSSLENVTFSYKRGTAASIPVVWNYEIPFSETLVMVQRLVLETGDKLLISGTSTNLKYVISLLETLK